MSSARRLLSATIVALAALAGAAQAATITEFPLPTANRQPAGIAAGPDGNLWFGELGASSLGTIHPGGTFTEKTGLSGPALAVAVTSSGDVWATEPAVREIAHLTPSGTLTQSGAPENGTPSGIAAGGDGDIWFTQSSPSKIERIAPNGTDTEYDVTNSSLPTAIAIGPDGGAWFTESANPGRVGQITPNGMITEHTIGLTANSDPSSITAGPDGNLWFTESASPGRIGRITPSGTITEYAAGLTPGSGPNSITAGPDGNLWFTESANPSRIGRITPDGTITEYSTGLTANSDPVGIASANGALWFTEQASPGRIGRLTPDIPTATTESASAVTPTSATLAGTVNPNRAATTYHFDFGTTTVYGQRSPAADAVVGADGAAHLVTQSLTGLLPSTTYDYRIVATSSTGTAYGTDANFTTPAEPSTLTTSNPIASPKPTPPTTAPPTMGRTAVAGVVSGIVLVRVPGSSTLQPLGAGRNIPMGSLINTTHGVVKVTDAIDRKGHTQSATVWAGSFVVTQARTGRGMTTFKLAGSLSCPSPHGVTTAAARSRAPVKLWGKDNHGRYTTRGRNSVATVRGTVWETVDSCAGTRTVVKRGVVSVRNLHRRTSVLVRAGHSYLARR
jgi:streptogramin lyase